MWFFFTTSEIKINTAQKAFRSKEQAYEHKKKLDEAKAAGNIGLASYYEKELDHLQAAVEKRQRLLRRK